MQPMPAASMGTLSTAASVGERRWGIEEVLGQSARPELRKHKTMKTMDGLLADDEHKHLENRSPNRPVCEPRGAPPAGSSRDAMSYTQLRDYEMATSILQSRQRVEIARQRSKISFGERTITLDRTFRTAPGGQHKVALGQSPPDEAVQRALRAASTAYLTRTPEAAASASGQSSSSSSGGDGGGNSSSGGKKKCKKSVSFRVDAPPLPGHERTRCSGDAADENAHVVSPIHAACRKGDVLVVKHLLSFYYGQEATKLVNSTCACGMTPLQVACDLGHVQIVGLLLRREARPDKRVGMSQRPPHSTREPHARRSSLSGGATDARGPAMTLHSGKKRHRSCLALASARRSLECIELLLEYGAQVDDDALITASGLGDVPIVRALMATQRKPSALRHGTLTTGIDKLFGSKIHSSTMARGSKATGNVIDSAWIFRAAHTAIINEVPIVLTVLLGDGRSGRSQETVIHCAREALALGDYRFLRVLTKMFDHALLINARDPQGNTLLHLAVKHASSKCVTLLIRLGVDVNARDANGITPLFMACARGLSAIARLLVNSGAACERMGPNQETPLHIAAQENHLNCVEILILEGQAPVDMTTGDGATPLHLACQLGNTHVAQFLLDRGADINARTTNDETPLIKASRMSNLDTVKLLVARNPQILGSSPPVDEVAMEATRVVATRNLTVAPLIPTETPPPAMTANGSPRGGYAVPEVESEECRSEVINDLGDDRPMTSGGDSIFIAKSNTHTSFKGWLRSVVRTKSS